MIADVGIAQFVGGLIAMLLVTYSVVLFHAARRYERRDTSSEPSDE